MPTVDERNKKKEFMKKQNLCAIRNTRRKENKKIKNGIIKNK